MPIRPFRFGLTIDPGNHQELVETVHQAEDLGFDVLAGVDHIGPPAGVLPLLAAVAQVSRLRVSPMVIANDYRHPALVAKDAATIDVLSEGRFELGIGTGWIEAHYQAAGIPYDSPGTRVARLVEALEVIKGCWTGDRFQFDGDHYQVDLVGSPVPIQQPHPPVLIAGSGPQMLRMAGEQADIVGITLTRGHRSFQTFGPAIARSGAALSDQLSSIRTGAGARFESLELSVMIHQYLSDDAQMSEMAAESGVETGQVESSPHVLVGSTERMCEALIRRREEHGLSYIVVRGAHLDRIGPVVMQLAGT